MADDEPEACLGHAGAVQEGRQESPFFPLWASATLDEILSALHERIVVGSPA